jgi:hypothetical protein
MNDLAATWLMHIGLPAVVSHSDGEPGAQQFAPYSALEALQANPDSIEAQRDYFAHGLALLSAWADPQDPMPWHYRLAGDVLEREGLKPGAETDDVRRTLAADMLTSVRAFADEVRRRLEAKPNLATQPVQAAKGSQTAWWDAALARSLERLQGASPDLIEAARADLDSGAKKAWGEGATACLERRWLEVGNRERWYGLRPMWRLALLTWQWHTQPRLKRVWSNPPGLPIATIRTVERNLLDPRIKSKVRRNERQVELGLDGEVVAQSVVCDVEILDAIAEGAMKFGGTTGLRLLWHIITRTQREQIRRNLPHDMAPDLTYNSWRELVEAIGEKPGRAELDAPKILRAFQYMRITWPDGEVGGLLSYEYQNTSGANGKPGRGARIIITPARILRTNYVQELHEGRLIVPLFDEPYLGAVPQERAHAIRFALKAVRAIVERRLDWHQAGGAALTDADVWGLAKSAGFSKQDRAFALWQAWQHDMPGHPAFLEAVAPGVYHLADNERYRQQRQYIDGTVQLSALRAKAGAVSVARARKKKPQLAKT